MITKTYLKYAIISMTIAAFFGITLNMTITCLIPVSFAAMFCAAYENFHNGIDYFKSIIYGAIPSIIGGLIIWLCFALKLWIGL